MPTSLLDECYRRAREARRSAEMASMPSQKTHFLELEHRWLRAAARVAPKAPLAGEKIVNVAFEQVDQPLQGTQGKDVAAPRPDELGDQQAVSANLVVMMQYRGLEQAIPLRLSNDSIAKLALEAEVRQISLGQLVGALIEAAMAEGLSGVLDGGPSHSPNNLDL